MRAGGVVGSLVIYSDPNRSYRRRETMHMDDELDLLDLAEADTERAAGEMDFANELDRRQFVFLSLSVTAAATTLRVRREGARAGRGRRRFHGQPRRSGPGPVVPLDNMDEVFVDLSGLYSGGTGPLLEKMYREKGPAAFARQRFAGLGDARAFMPAPGTAHFLGDGRGDRSPSRAPSRRRDPRAQAHVCAHHEDLSRA